MDGRELGARLRELDRGMLPSSGTVEDDILQGLFEPVGVQSVMWIADQRRRNDIGDLTSSDSSCCGGATLRLGRRAGIGRRVTDSELAQDGEPPLMWRR